MTSSQSPERLLADGAITLPPAPTPTGDYLPAVLGAGLLEVSGQVAFIDGELTTGRVGDDITTDQASVMAEVCARNALSIARATTGSLDSLAVQRVRVFVACTPGYAEQHLVANGASAYLRKVFGERGRHARTAIGVQALPLGAPVEVEITFRTNDSELN